MTSIDQTDIAPAITVAPTTDKTVGGAEVIDSAPDIIVAATVKDKIAAVKADREQRRIATIAANNGITTDDPEERRRLALQAIQARTRRTMNRHGFRSWSDSAKIVDIMLEGGLDRQDINEKVAQAIGPKTRSGCDKNIPSLVSGLLSRLVERGYTVESSWRIIEPPDLEPAADQTDQDTEQTDTQTDGTD